MLGAQSEFSYLANVEQVAKLYYDTYIHAQQHSKAEEGARAHMLAATFAAQKKFARHCSLAHIPIADYASCFSGEFTPSYFMQSSFNVLRVGAGAIAYDTYRDRKALDTLQHVPFSFMYCGLTYEYVSTENRSYTGFAAYGFVHAKIDFVPQDHLVLIPLEALTIHERPAINN